MALQSGSGGSNNDTKLIVLTPKSQDKDKNPVKPYFQIDSKNEEGKWVTNDDKTTDRVSGRLKRVIAKVKEFKRGGVVVDTKDIVQVFLEDDAADETYLIDFNYKISTRRLFVRLLALESFENVQISYWRDKEGYDVLTLRQNDEVVKAKFTKEEMPLPKKVKINKVEMTDNSDLDAFLKEKLLELNDKISQAPKTQSVQKQKTQVVVNNEVAAEDVKEDDIPF